MRPQLLILYAQPTQILEVLTLFFTSLLLLSILATDNLPNLPQTFL